MVKVLIYSSAPGLEIAPPLPGHYPAITPPPPFHDLANPPDAMRLSLPARFIFSLLSISALMFRHSILGTR